MRFQHPRRGIRLVLGFAGLTLPLTWAGTALAATTPAPAVVQAPASALLAALNSARTSAGLAPLSSAGDLVAVANEQALAMATDGYLFHNPYLETQVANWQALGENVGCGLSTSTIQSAFMGSTEHRDNILSTQFTQVGIGTVSYKGMIWVTEDFRLPTAAAARVTTVKTSTTAKPAPAPAPRPVNTAVVVNHPVATTQVASIGQPAVSSNIPPVAPSTAPPASLAASHNSSAPIATNSNRMRALEQLDSVGPTTDPGSVDQQSPARALDTNGSRNSAWRLVSGRSYPPALPAAVAIASLLAALALVMGRAGRTTTALAI